MIKWKIELKRKAVNSLDKLDRQVQERIRLFLRELVLQDNPRLQGKALTGRYAGKWRYRIGDYRLICQIKGGELLILVLELGHRKEIYK